MLNNKTIVQKLSNSTYSLLINGEYNTILYEMLLKIFKLSFFDDNTNTLIFTAENQKFLSKFLKEEEVMPYNKCIRMIDEITKQLSFLYNNGYGFYGFDIDDILIINDNSFVIVSCKYLMPLENNFIFINNLPEIPNFSNPEINIIKHIPAKLDHRAIYYSLGVLVGYCLLNCYEITDLERDIEEIILPLKNTKIYWFLKRCLYKDCTKRKLLLI